VSISFRVTLYNVRKYCRARQATYDNIAHAHFMLDTNTHSEYVILITTLAMVAQSALMLRYTYVHLLSCSEEYNCVHFAYSLLCTLQILPLSSLFDQPNNIRMLFHLTLIICHVLSFACPIRVAQSSHTLQGRQNNGGNR
jgi:hypothetical protein